jgi:outer membrane protein TolC
MPNRPAPRTHQRPVPALLLCAGVALSGSPWGCGGNPFAERDSDLGKRLDPSRFHSVDTFDAARYAAPPQPEPAPLKPNETPQRPASRFAGMTEVPLDLSRCRASALENNLDLKVALVDPTIASQRLRQERAKFEAVFTPSVRYREQDDPVFDVTNPNQQDSASINLGVDVPMRTGGRASIDLDQGWNQTDNPFFTFNTAYSAGVGFSLSQPLLRNAGRSVNVASIQIQSYQEQIVQARTKLEVIRQVAAVDRAYWRLYAARKALDVAQQQFDLAADQLRQAQSRFRAGAVAEVEVLRAQSGLAQRLEGIISAENAVLINQRTLKQVINLPGLELDTPQLVVTATEPAPVAYDFNGPELAQQAIGPLGRMEMLELELQLAADAVNTSFARNQTLPLVTLDYTYRIGGLSDRWIEANDTVLNNDFETWTVGLSGQIPLGNEAAKASLQQAILTRLQRLSTKAARELAIRREVLDAVDQARSAWQRILASRQSVLAAGRTLEAERRQNAVGARTSTDVLDAAARLAEAQLDEIRALTDYQISIVDLAFATGTLLGSGSVEWQAVKPEPDDVPLPFPPLSDG